MADGDVLLLPTEDRPVDRQLGRAGVNHDERNRLFPAREMAPRLLEPRTTPWHSTVVFNQIGPSCTTAAAIGLIRTQPNTTLTTKRVWPDYDTEDERFSLYKLSQRYDPWEGEDYDGASGDAPLRVLRERQQIKEWRWLFGLAEVRHHLQYTGPVSVGTWWYWSMDVVDAKGFTRIRDEDGTAGGHQWRIVHYDENDHRYRMVNSWGRGWGQSGRAWISEADLERLLNEQGDAVVVVI